MDATTISMMTLTITTLSISVLSIDCYAECLMPSVAFFVAMSVVMPSAVMPIVVVVNVVAT